jgi:uncharacterized DUF497 family protein
MDIVKRIADCEGFDRDAGNVGKIWERHEVSAVECEQIFFNGPLVAMPDEKHSDREERFYVLGDTDAGRFLYVVFTTRNRRIRPISARDMNRKERKEYEVL